MNFNDISILATSVQNKTKGTNRKTESNESIGSEITPSILKSQIATQYPNIDTDIVNKIVQRNNNITQEIFKSMIEADTFELIHEDVLGLKVAPYSSEFLFTTNPIHFNMSSEAQRYMIDDASSNPLKLQQYLNIMEDFKSGKKSVYMFDLETMGLNSQFMDKNLTNSQSMIPKNFFAITEASLLKLDMHEGTYKANVEASFFSSPMALKQTIDGVSTNIPAHDIIKSIYKYEGKTNIMEVTARRLAGYSLMNLGDGEAPTVSNVIFNGNTNLADKDAIAKGIENVQKFNVRGSQEYLQDVANFVYSIDKIVSNGDVIMTRNGSVFDFAQLIGEMTTFKEEGSNEYIIPKLIRDIQKANGVSDENLFSLENFKNKVEQQHIDTLAMSRMLGTEITAHRVEQQYTGKHSLSMDDLAIEMQEYYKRKGDDAEKAFNKKIANAAASIGFSQDVVDRIAQNGVTEMQHTGAIDNIVQVAAAEYFHDVYGDIAKQKLSGIVDGINIYNNLKFDQDDNLSKFLFATRTDPSDVAKLQDIGKTITDLTNNLGIQFNDIDDLYSTFKDINSAQRRLSNTESTGFLKHLIQKEQKEILNNILNISGVDHYYNKIDKFNQQREQFINSTAPYMQGLSRKESVKVAKQDIQSAKQIRNQARKDYNQLIFDLAKRDRMQIKKEHSATVSGIWSQLKDVGKNNAVTQEIIDSVNAKRIDIASKENKQVVIDLLQFKDKSFDAVFTDLKAMRDGVSSQIGSFIKEKRLYQSQLNALKKEDAIVNYLTLEAEAAKKYQKRNEILKKYGYQDGIEFFAKDFALYQKGSFISHESERTGKKDKRPVISEKFLNILDNEKDYEAVHNLNKEAKDLKNLAIENNKQHKDLIDSYLKIQEEITHNNGIISTLMDEKNDITSIINLLSGEFNPIVDSTIQNLKGQEQQAKDVRDKKLSQTTFQSYKNNTPEHILKELESSKEFADLTSSQEMLDELYNIGNTLQENNKAYYNAIDNAKEAKQKYYNVLNRMTDKKLDDLYEKDANGQYILDSNGNKVFDKRKTFNLTYESLIDDTPIDIPVNATPQERHKIEQTNKKNKEVADFIKKFSKEEFESILFSEDIKTVNDILFDKNNPITNTKKQILDHILGLKEIEDVGNLGLLKQNAFIGASNVQLGNDTFNFIIYNGELMTSSKSNFISKDTAYYINIAKASDITLENGNNLVSELQTQLQLLSDEFGDKVQLQNNVIDSDSFIVQLQEINSNDSTKSSYAIFKSKEDLEKNFLNKGLFKKEVISTEKALADYLMQHNMDTMKRMHNYVTSQYVNELSLTTVRDAINVLTSHVSDSLVDVHVGYQTRKVLHEGGGQKFAFSSLYNKYLSSDLSNNNPNVRGDNIHNLHHVNLRPLGGKSSLKRVFNNSTEAFLLFNDNMMHNNVNAIQELFSRQLLIPKAKTEAERKLFLDTILDKNITHSELINNLFSFGINNTSGLTTVASNFEVGGNITVEGFAKADILSDGLKAKQLSKLNKSYNGTLIKYANTAKDYLLPNAQILSNIIDNIDDKYSKLTASSIAAGLSQKSLDELNKTKTNHFIKTINHLKNNYLDSLSDEEIFTALEQIDNKFKKRLEAKKGTYDYLLREEVKNKYGYRLESAPDYIIQSAKESLEKEGHSDILSLQKDAFFNTYGVNYDYGQGKHILLEKFTDTEVVEGNIKNVNRLSFKTFDNTSHKVIDLTTKQKFAEDFARSVHTQFYTKDTDTTAKRLIKANYVKDVAGDLLNRGILNKQQYIELTENVLKGHSIEPAAQFLAESIFNNKEEVLKILDQHSKQEFGFLKPDEKLARYKEVLEKNPHYKQVQKFAENLVDKEVSGYQTYSMNGLTLQQLVEETVKRRKGVSDVTQEEVQQYVKGVVDSSSIVSKDTMIIETLTDKTNPNHTTSNLAQVVGDKLGWSDEHKGIFQEAIEKYVFNKRYEINSFGDTINPSFMILENDSRVYLAVSKDNTLLHDAISKGGTIEDLKKHNMIIQLPKIEDHGGVKFVNQSKFSQKAIVQTVNAKALKDGTVQYKVQNTVTEMLGLLRDELGFAVDKLVKENQPNGANYSINKVWRSIHESKTLTSSSYQGVVSVDENGKFIVGTDYKKGMNPNDFHKNDNIFVKSLMLEMGDAIAYADENLGERIIVLPDGTTTKDTSLNALANEYRDAVKMGTGRSSSTAVQDLQAKIANIIQQSSGSNRGNVLKSDSFDKLFNDPTHRLFFYSNIDRFADIMLQMHEDPSSSKVYDPSLVEVLKQIKEVGRYAAINVKPGESDRGMINLSMHKSAGMVNDLGNLARLEVGLQDMSAKSLSVENVLANKIIQDNIEYVSDLPEGFHIGDVFKQMGVTPGRSGSIGEAYYRWYEQEYAKNIANGVDNGVVGTIGFKQGFDGFVAKVKHMTPNQLKDIMDEIRLSSGDYKDLKETIKNNIQTAYNITDESFENYFSSSLNRIMMSASLYEDSRMGHVNLMYLKNPTSVKNYTVKNIADYENLGISSPRKLQIGDFVEDGDIVGIDIDGKPVKTKFSGVISNIETDASGNINMQVENIDAANTMKINIAGVERGMTTVPNFQGNNKLETEIYKKIIGQVQDKIFDGALILANPDLIKHDASTIPFTSRLINIAKSVKTDAEAVEVQKILDQAQTAKLKIHKSKDATDVMQQNEYVITYDSIGQKGQHLKDYGLDDDMFMIEREILSNTALVGVGTGMLQLYKENLNGVFFVNMSNASFNAINSMKSDISDLPSGSSLTFRRLIAMTDIVTNMDGMMTQDGGVSHNIIDRSMQNWIKEHYASNLQDIREVQNIVYSLRQEFNPKSVDGKIKIQNMSLNDIIPDAKYIDDVFSTMFDKFDAPNVIAVDISHLQIKNPYFVKDGTAVFKTLAKQFPEVFDPVSMSREYLDTLYIPVIKANKIGDATSLSDIQKSAADILRTLQEINDPNKAVSIEESMEKAYNKLIKYDEALIDSLISKDGKAKQLFKTKQAPLTGRSLNQTVIAPVYTDAATKTLVSPYFGSIVEINSAGKRQLNKVTFVNPQYFLDKTKFHTFENLGKEILMSRQTSDITKQLDVINDVLSRHNVEEAVSSIEQAQKLLDGKVNSNILEDIGRDFMSKVGLEGGFHRSPAIRPESDTFTFIRTHEGITYGMFGQDPYSGKYAKLDTDGDTGDLNFNISIGFDENGLPVIKKFDDAVRAQARKGAIVTSERALNLFDDMVESEKQHNITNVFLMEHYIQQSEGFKALKARDASSNIFNNAAFIQGMASTQSKAIIGQASNPAYFLKAAAQEYVMKLDKEGRTLEGFEIQSSIATGSFLVEQNSIDQKIQKFIEDGGNFDELDDSVKKQVYGHINKVKQMQKSYDNIFKAVRNNHDYNELQKHVQNLLEVMQDHVLEAEMVKDGIYTIPMGKDGPISGEKLVWQNGTKPQNAEEFKALAKDILDGDITRSHSYRTHTIESFIYDMIQVFKDDTAAKAYSSAIVSTYNRNLKELDSGARKLFTLFEVMASYEGEGLAGPGIIDIINSGNLSDEIKFNINVNNKNKETSSFMLTYNTPLDKAVVTTGVHHIAEGIYDITQSDFKGGQFSVEFTNIIDGSSQKIYGSTPQEISEILNSMNIQTEASEATKAQMLENYVTRAFTNTHGIMDGVGFMASIMDPYLSQAANTVFPIDDSMKGTPDEILKQAISKKVVPIAKQAKSENNIKMQVNSFINGMISNNFIDGNDSSFISDLRQQLNESIINRSRADKQFDISQINQYIGEMVFDKSNQSLSGLQNTFNAYAVPFGSVKFIEDQVTAGSAKTAETVFDKIMINNKKEAITRQDLLQVSALISERTLEYDDLSFKFQSKRKRKAKDKQIAELRQEHIEKLADTMESANNLNYEARKIEAINDITAFSHDREFINKVSEIQANSSIVDVGELTIGWRQDYVLTKAKHLSNKQLKELLQQASDMDGINDEFVQEIKKQISFYLKFREDNNLHEQMRLVDDQLTELVKSIEGTGILEELNQEIIDKGLKGQVASIVDVVDEIEDGTIFEKLKKKSGQFIDKNKTAIGVGGLFGLGMMAVMGYNIRNNIKAIKQREDEEKAKNANRRESVPMSNKMYVNDSNNINVNIRARKPLGHSVQDATESIMSAFGSGVDINTSYSDSTSEISEQEISDIMADSINY